jgi:mono/diheme cytochrome c family protein
MTLLEMDSYMKRITTGGMVLLAITLVGCKASQPGSLEASIAEEVKHTITIGGKDWKNPTADSKEAVQGGAQLFQRHCQVCHGLDGHSTGVPFADKMSPPVPDLAAKGVQGYADGQLKWIIQNGIAPSGMPGWADILDEEAMWKIVRYIRHLPPSGSLGAPIIYRQADAEESTGKR